MWLRYPTVSGSTYVVSATSSGSAHTKGAWTEIISATAQDTLLDTIFFGPGLSGLQLVDIAIGAPGSEQVILSNIMVQVSTAATTPLQAYFTLSDLRIPIPAGSRLAIRTQGNTASLTMACMVLLRVPTRADERVGYRPTETFGVNTGTTRGTSLDPGGTINTKSGYTQIVAATAQDIERLMVRIGNQGNTAPSGYNWALDVSVGAAAAEQVAIPDLYAGSSSLAASGLALPSTYYLETAIPAGSRLAMRAACSGNDATDRLLDVALYGFARARF